MENIAHQHGECQATALISGPFNLWPIAAATCLYVVSVVIRMGRRRYGCGSGDGLHTLQAILFAACFDIFDQQEMAFVHHQIPIQQD